ncbi:iron-sulfur cluster biosynthesis family protein [Levilactobacillus suantsaii]|uniref:Iron-sulfur cluster biosynthesis family protein n=1 Tax=Levilactobacillus suantsaii TaxID=2292255 RepID=A0A4Q0VHZ0_9LACO|nr:iron-sulfur cluster biosynthesis family protein [Levilactobacillus suantsaii]QMU09181.1 iron-sulfur cluster biosynthesis family protein [Levilactobacillus suantsaii]RXI76115.1 iron-sulfur cluster biosynthesis family protein [Levilactobacillus suantsaii]
MDIKIKDAAKDYLAEHVKAGSILLLVTDDGSNRYSTIGGSCAIGNKFQLVALTEEDPDYQLEINNNAGYQMRTNNDDAIYLGNGLVLDRKNNQLALRDDSGILDSAVGLIKYTAEEKSKLDLKKEMQTLGTRIC